jgi:hypothetical protein
MSIAEQSCRGSSNCGRNDVIAGFGSGLDDTFDDDAACMPELIHELAQAQTLLADSQAIQLDELGLRAPADRDQLFRLIATRRSD